MRLCLLDCRLSGSSRYGRMSIRDATLVTGPVYSLRLPRAPTGPHSNCCRASGGGW